MPGLDSINQIRVTMYIPGTNFITKPNIGGIFSFENLPQGTYRIIFDPTNTDYFVKILGRRDGFILDGTLSAPIADPTDLSRQFVTFKLTSRFPEAKRSD